LILAFVTCKIGANSNFVVETIKAQKLGGVDSRGLRSKEQI